jgi:hypothetical protein
LKKDNFHQFNSDFHKEKEMVDFRKWLLALAIVGLLLGISSSSANAQTTPPPTFTCSGTSGSSGVNNLLRAEGITELLGDLILDCTGGTPTTTGSSIPLQNIQISINTNITSRIVGTGNLSEALLMIDEPYPSGPEGGQNPPTPFAPAPTYNATTQLACQATNNTNCLITSVGPGIGAAGSYNGSAGHYNVFQGYQTGNNVIAFTGVPVDAPGTAGTRVIRITNVRANAFQLGVSSTLIPTQISMLIAVSGSTFITINQPSNGTTVGTVVPGLNQPPGISVGGVKGPGSYAQCTSVNGYLLPGGSGVTDAGVVVSAQEGFAASWKVQNYGEFFDVRYGAAADYVPPGGALSSSFLQNIPGFTYDTESGFFSNITGLIEPAGGTEAVGLADTGTELQFTVTGVGAGVSLYAPSYVYLTGNYGSTTPIGVAVLVSQGAFSTGGAFGTASGIPVVDAPGTGTNGPATSITISGTSATLVYEIYYSDPSVQETLSVPISVAYISNTGSNIPATTTTPATVGVEFSPQSTVTTASAGPIPRFGPSGSPSNFFTISPCTCNLLFPFVANIAGFDTGIAIANTSLDIYGTSPQTGTISLNYFGTTSGGGAAPPKQTTSSPVPGGSELIFTLSNGGNYGIVGTPGFEGYIIAQTNFQFCHGFAEITDQGAQRLGSGYLALQLDEPFSLGGATRTGNFGEVDAH